MIGDYICIARREVLAVVQQDLDGIYKDRIVSPHNSSEQGYRLFTTLLVRTYEMQLQNKLVGSISQGRMFSGVGW